jgi:hypothetical protein
MTARFGHPSENAEQFAFGIGTETEREPVRKEFEYRDVQGRLIGWAKIELEPDVLEIDRPDSPEIMRGRVLRSFVLTGEKDGAKTDIDILEMTGAAGTRILVAADVAAGSSYYRKERLAFVPMPDTPLGIGLMLHELGHASQADDEKLAEINRLYDSGRVGGGGFSALAAARAASRLSPEIGGLLEKDSFKRLEELEQRKGALEEQAAKFRAEREKLSALKDEAARNLVRRHLEQRLPADEFGEECLKAAGQMLGAPEGDAGKAEPMSRLMEKLEGAGFEFGSVEKGRRTGGTEPSSGRLLPRDEVNRPWMAEKLVGEAGDKIGAGDINFSEVPESGWQVRLRIPARDVLFDRHDRDVGLTLDVGGEERDSYLVGQKDIDDMIGETEWRLAEARAEIMSLVSAADLAAEDPLVKAAVELPTRVVERDATKRAIGWLRAVRRLSGADLFAPLAAQEKEAETAEPQGGCESSFVYRGGVDEAEGAVVSVMESFREALRSYGADQSVLKASREDK